MVIPKPCHALPSTAEQFACPNVTIKAPVTKLRELLEQHGDFKAVELEISKWNKTVNNCGHEGQWVTKQYLMDVEKYTRFPVGNQYALGF